MSAETIRVITASEARSNALVSSLDGLRGEAVSEDGLHEVQVRLDAATAATLLHLFDALGDWLESGDERSCAIYLGDQTLTIVLPSDDKAAEESQFLLERTIQLQSALESRVAIEQAKGVLAERLDVSLEEASAFLRSAARSQGVKLSQLAAEVVHSPETPPAVALLSDRRP